MTERGRFIEFLSKNEFSKWFVVKPQFLYVVSYTHMYIVNIITL